mmetsp:Transcript_15525/g.48347  ORF Transcript_15525/g.48347 Transcript_15525/m.48347 type:complete len:320 (-) Transcript_15525:70-1029(-)
MQPRTASRRFRLAQRDRTHISHRALAAHAHGGASVRPVPSYAAARGARIRVVVARSGDGRSGQRSDGHAVRGELEPADGLIEAQRELAQHLLVLRPARVGREEEHFVEELPAHHRAEQLVVDERRLAQQPAGERVRHGDLLGVGAVRDKGGQLEHEARPLRHRQPRAAAGLVPLAREARLSVADRLGEEREERLLLRLADGDDEAGRGSEERLDLELRLHDLRVQLEQQLPVLKQAALVGILRSSLVIGARVGAGRVGAVLVLALALGAAGVLAALLVAAGLALLLLGAVALAVGATVGAIVRVAAVSSAIALARRARP